MTDWTPGEAALTIPCARCEAKPGDPCTTITGHRATTHAARWNPLADANGAGYIEGLADGRAAQIDQAIHEATKGRRP